MSQYKHHRVGVYNQGVLCCVVLCCARVPGVCSGACCGPVCGGGARRTGESSLPKPHAGESLRGTGEPRLTLLPLSEPQ